MRNDAKQDIETLESRNKWLFDHMITAFWHTFGLSNGLDFKPEDVEVRHYKKGTPRSVTYIKPEVMQAKLAEYLKWLESYQEKWDTPGHPDGYPTDQEDLYDPCHKSRLPIAKMIELLQV